MAERGFGPKPLFLLMGLVVALVALSFLPVKSTPPANERKIVNVASGQYNGSGSCNAKPCHGETLEATEDMKDRTRRGILQNEYVTWASRDPHFGSYNALQSERACRMMKILRASQAGKEPEKPSEHCVPEPNERAVDDPSCRSCHALTPTKSNDLKARIFDDEGIGCENCHGASSGWFAEHYKTDWATAESIHHGLYEIDDPVKRAEKCLSCHLGNENQEVSHELIAAGHPDLFFEMDLFSAKEPEHWAEPPHWTEPKLRVDRKRQGKDELPPWADATSDPNFKVRLWAVGQAVQLREALKRVQRRAKSGKWPEYSELDCFSCHHSIRSNWFQPPLEQRVVGLPSNKPQSWRQDNGYDKRAAGSPSWNRAHYTVFLIMLREISRQEANNLEAALDELFKAVSKPASSADAVKKAADAAFSLANAGVAKVNRHFEDAFLADLLLKISGDAKLIASRDTRTAEQAYMALDSLFSCWEARNSTETHQSKTVKNTLERLYREFDNPSFYDALRFQKEMDELHSELKEAIRK